MKLAMNSDAISQDFETAVLLGIEWGIEYFELKRMYGSRIPDISDNNVKVVQKVLRDNGVCLSSLAPGLFRIPLDKELIEREAGERFDMTMVLADRLDTRSVVVFGFVRDDSCTEASAISRIIDIFGPLAEKAEREGITLFLENDRGLWGESPESVLKIVSGIDSPAFRLNWDPGNLVGAFPEPAYPDCYEIVREYVGHVHVKDASATGKGQFEHAMINSGDIDWVGQFESLLRNNYQGFCVIEPHFGNRISSSREHIIEAHKALRLAKRRLASTGS